jgi:hypothetical protein
VSINASWQVFHDKELTERQNSRVLFAFER